MRHSCSGLGTARVVLMGLFDSYFRFRERRPWHRFGTSFPSTSLLFMFSCVVLRLLSRLPFAAPPLCKLLRALFSVFPHACRHSWVSSLFFVQHGLAHVVVYTASAAVMEHKYGQFPVVDCRLNVQVCSRE